MCTKIDSGLIELYLTDRHIAVLIKRLQHIRDYKRVLS